MKIGIIAAEQEEFEAILNIAKAINIVSVNSPKINGFIENSKYFICLLHML